MSGKTLHLSDKRERGAQKKRRRLALVGLLSLAVIPSLLLASLLARPVHASHGGPVIQVDVSAERSEDTDGDHHFKTLRAAFSSGPAAPEPYDTIIVEPGRYRGPLIVEVKGLTIKSTGGASRTVIDGPVEIRAADVRLEGFAIEGDGVQAGVRITGADAVLIGNRISHAGVGVLIEGTNGVTLRDNAIYNHSKDGLLIRDAWRVEVMENSLRGNKGLGALIEGSREVVLKGNTLAFNGPGGIWLRRAQRAEVVKNTVRDNELIGIVLEGSTEARVRGNQLVSNEAGILLLDSGGNEVVENEVRHQRSVGLVLKNGAGGNTVRGNVVRGSQGRGATGIRLAGNVFDNRFTENRIAENGVGIVLIANGSGSPVGNLFQENEVSSSDGVGVRIEPGARRNRFQGNRIHRNLDAGISAAGEATVYQDNEITDSGTAGIVLSDSHDARLQGNRIQGNGAEGIRLERSSGTLLSGNEISHNVRAGVRITASRNMRLLKNALSDNGGSGLIARETLTLILSDNEVKANRESGIRVAGATGLELSRNELEENGNGGINLEGVRTADLESNRITENLHYGLRVQRSEGISARRNYWGDRSGPSGAFAGAGNAVLGLPLDQVTPWLPAEPEEVLLSSVASLVIDSPSGRRIEFDASDRLGLTLELFHLGRGGSGRSGLISKGIVLAARYASAPQDAPALHKGMSYYALTVEGADAGTARLTLFYDEEDQPPGIDPQRLRIFILEGGRWHPLSGRADSDLRRITGEIDIQRLDGRLIGLGMVRREGGPAELDLPLGIGPLRPPLGWPGFAALMILLGLTGYLYYRPERRGTVQREITQILSDLPPILKRS